MIRLFAAFIAILIVTAALPARATEVRMIGDARIHGTFFAQQNYTGWNPQGTGAADTFVIWQRFRLRSDFIANENLKFRFSMRANNTAWGNNYLAVDNPAVSIQVWQAYLQFKWPGTEAEFIIGLPEWTLPVSSPAIFNANPVYGGTRSAVALVNIPFNERVTLTAGFSRFMDTNGPSDPTTTQVPDELDGYQLTLPVTLDGFSATPWAMLAVAGRNVNYSGMTLGTTNSAARQTLAGNLLSAGNALPPAGFGKAQDFFWWAGGAFAVTALDPLKFYADVVYGQGGAADRSKNRRSGLFLDAAVEYAGLDWLTPQASFWYSTGEDSSTVNGSERLPVVVGYWGPSSSFLFDSNQAYTRSVMGVSTVGNWGLALSLNKVSFVENLTHRLTFTYVRGTNSPRALRAANALWPGANYVQMGRDLAESEYLLAVNLDQQYDIYQNLAFIVEAGWSHGEFQQSVWGRRLVDRARDGDPVKVAFGFKYQF